MSYILPIITFSASSLINSYVKGVASNPNLEVEKPELTSTILICTLNEASFIERCLQSIHENTIYKLYPEYFNIWLVDSYSYDETVDLARPYVDRILFSSPGKLTARDLGNRISRDDLIINTDADAIVPIQWLNLIHKNFKNPEVVALTGTTFGWNYIIDRTYCVAAFILRPNMRLSGRNSAFLRKYYIESGGFNLDIDQQNVDEMVWEEEIRLAHKLAEFGKIVFEPLVYVTEMTKRRYSCKHVDTDTCDPNDTLCSYCRQIERGERFGGV